MPRWTHRLTFLLTLCLLSGVSAGPEPARQDAPAYKLVVTAHGPALNAWGLVAAAEPTPLQVSVEAFSIDGVPQPAATHEVPFELEVASERFEVTLRRVAGTGDITAALMRNTEGAWHDGGLTGVGAKMTFALTETTGQVYGLE